MPPLFLLRNWVLHLDKLHHIYNQSYKVSRTKKIKLPMIQAESKEMTSMLKEDCHMTHSNSYICL